MVAVRWSALKSERNTARVDWGFAKKNSKNSVKFVESPYPFPVVHSSSRHSNFTVTIRSSIGKKKKNIRLKNNNNKRKLGLKARGRGYRIEKKWDTYFFHRKIQCFERIFIEILKFFYAPEKDSDQHQRLWNVKNNLIKKMENRLRKNKKSDYSVKIFFIP